MPYLYGEAFQRVGIKSMGRQGAPWCALNAEGELVLMAHQNYFHNGPEGYYYELPRYDPMPQRVGSAARSLQMIDDYFLPGRAIHLLVALFDSDGGLRPDGSFEAAHFAQATGVAYRAKMSHFDLATAQLVCNNLVRYQY